MSKPEAIARGVLFPNDRKVNPNQPDMTGPVDWGDKKLRIAAWAKKKDGKTFLSFEISEPTQSQEGNNASLDDVLPNDGF